MIRQAYNLLKQAGGYLTTQQWSYVLDTATDALGYCSCIAALLLVCYKLGYLIWLGTKVGFKKYLDSDLRQKTVYELASLPFFILILFTILCLSAIII